MKRSMLIIFFNCALCIMNCALSQNPLVKMWDYRYGGTDDDYVTSFKSTDDGGFIMAGVTSSGLNGDKTQINQGDKDYWIVKVDSLGHKEWDKDFGGTDDDRATSVIQTYDHGYLIGGLSKSGISGNKTQPGSGGYDYWIVKMDSLGNQQWDRDFGGLYDDALNCLLQTTDSGFIAGGSISYGIFGTWDYGIIKVDVNGNMQWQEDYGGTNGDIMYSINSTIDGGYILGGYSYSGIGGMKTSANQGAGDFWVIKIDSSRVVQWEKDYGGTNDDLLFNVIQTKDSGYVLGGTSQSPAGIYKTQNTWGAHDYWLIKTDSIGNKIWDHDYGGTGSEAGWNALVQEDSSGYLLIGSSSSPASGDKTENNLGNDQAWIVSTNINGTLLWNKTVFTNPEITTIPNIIRTGDGCYVIGMGSYGDIAGDKSELNRDLTNATQDFWIVKYCDSSFIQANFSATINLCPGTCNNFTNISFNATAYQWSFPGAIPDTSTSLNPANICYATPGIYDVQLIASNTNGSDTLLLTNYITVFPTPSPQSITQSGDTLFAIAGSASYQWYFNGDTISGATDYFYVAPQSGDYNVVATDANGCEVEAAVFNVVAGIQSTVDSGQWTIFPNPVRDKVKIHPDSYRELKVTSETAVEISIYNVLGEMMSAVCLPTAYCSTFGKPTATEGPLPTCSIDVSTLTPGLYYIEITSSGKTFRSKFVKQ